ncbi:MAG TPA: ABC transporter permease [Verrucomicrobiae bacterium]|nr:ABC transporter permease [Verrucomicrobiae bacterium]
MLSGLRALWRRPVFASAAILTVALGIGANTALFGVIYAVLIRPLPFRDPGRLVQIWETHPALPQLQVTVPDFRDWRTQTRSFEQLAAYTLSAMNNGTLLGQGEPEAVHATMASSNLFSAMGIEPMAGRAFSDAEERTKQQVALISENLWRHKFGPHRAVVGTQIRVDAQSFRVVGVVPQRQAFPEWADLWIPLSLIEDGLASRRKFHPLEVMARLRPEVTAEQAQAEMQAVALRLAHDYPDTNATVGAVVVPLAREITGGVRPSLLLAWAAVGLVLLIACANLAHLFLARMIERRQEMAIRQALGAGAWDLVRQLMAESLLVAAIGGAAGVILAAWAGQLARTLANGQIPRMEESGIAGPVWLFAAGVSLVTGVLFGLPACWQVTRGRSEMAAAGRSIVRGRSWLSPALMAGEVALALVVLSGAALLTRNFAALLSENPGFDARQVWTIPNLPLRADFNKSGAFFTDRLAPALRAVPGVEDVAAVNAAPMSLGPAEHSRFATRFGIEGRTFEAGSYPVTQNRWLTPQYFQAMGIPLKHGRWLNDADGNQPVILVNETLARRFFPNQDAAGKRLVMGVMDPKQQAIEIVGVVGDVREFGLDREVEPAIYGVGVGPVMTVVVKMAGGSSAAGALREAVHAADPEIPVKQVQPLQQNVADSLARRRFALVLIAVFGGIAAFLTACGIYGLFTQSVNARVREFGVRAAVGAKPGELVGMILREAVVLIAPGLAAGAVLSLAFARLMKSMVSLVSPADPLSVSSAAVLLVALTFVSAWLPAMRAAAVDPAAALRSD